MERNTNVQNKENAKVKNHIAYAENGNNRKPSE